MDHQCLHINRAHRVGRVVRQGRLNKTGHAVEVSVEVRPGPLRSKEVLGVQRCSSRGQSTTGLRVAGTPRTPGCVRRRARWSSDRRRVDRARAIRRTTSGSERDRVDRSASHCATQAPIPTMPTTCAGPPPTASRTAPASTAWARVVAGMEGSSPTNQGLASPSGRPGDPAATDQGTCLNASVGVGAPSHHHQHCRAIAVNLVGDVDALAADEWHVGLLGRGWSLIMPIRRRWRRLGL